MKTILLSGSACTPYFIDYSGIVTAASIVKEHHLTVRGRSISQSCLGVVIATLIRIRTTSSKADSWLRDVEQIIASSPGLVPPELNTFICSLPINGVMNLHCMPIFVQSCPKDKEMLDKWLINGTIAKSFELLSSFGFANSVHLTEITQLPQVSTCVTRSTTVESDELITIPLSLRDLDLKDLESDFVSKTSSMSSVHSECFNLSISNTAFHSATAQTSVSTLNNASAYLFPLLSCGIEENCLHKVSLQDIQFNSKWIIVFDDDLELHYLRRQAMLYIMNVAASSGRVSASASNSSRSLVSTRGSALKFSPNQEVQPASNTCDSTPVFGRRKRERGGPIGSIAHAPIVKRAFKFYDYKVRKL